MRTWFLSYWSIYFSLRILMRFCWWLLSGNLSMNDFQTIFSLVFHFYVFFCRAVIEWSKIDFHPSITCFCWNPLQDKSASTLFFNKQSQDQASLGAQKEHARLYGIKINHDCFVGRQMKLCSVRGTHLEWHLSIRFQ